MVVSRKNTENNMPPSAFIDTVKVEYNMYKKDDSNHLSCINLSFSDIAVRTNGST